MVMTLEESDEKTRWTGTMPTKLWLGIATKKQ